MYIEFFMNNVDISISIRVIDSNNEDKLQKIMHSNVL